MLVVETDQKNKRSRGTPAQKENAREEKVKRGMKECLDVVCFI